MHSMILSHFTDEDREALAGFVVCLLAEDAKMAEPGFIPQWSVP